MSNEVVDMWRARYTRGGEQISGHTGLTIDLYESRREMELSVLGLLIEAESSNESRPDGEKRRWHLFRQWFKATDERHRDRREEYGCIRFHGLDRLIDGQWVEHTAHVTEPQLIVAPPKVTA